MLAIIPNILRGPKRCLTTTGPQFQVHAFHVVPSIGSIVSVVNIHGHRKTCSGKVDQLTKSGDGTRLESIMLA